MKLLRLIALCYETQPLLSINRDTNREKMEARKLETKNRMPDRATIYAMKHKIEEYLLGEAINIASAINNHPALPTGSTSRPITRGTNDQLTNWILYSR